MKKIVLTLGKVVVTTSVISVLMMLLLAFIMLKMDVGEEVQKAFVILIYIVSTFVGGLIMGKVMENRKFLWGMACGMLYFLVILIIALAVKNSGDVAGLSVLLTMAVCLLGGTLGGMAG